MAVINDVMPAFELFEPTTTDDALALLGQYGSDAWVLAGGLDIMAPWGERQTIEKGYLLRNGDEIYGNDAKAFRATYEILR